MSTGYTYLIHFDAPIGENVRKDGTKHYAQHYLGAAVNLQGRMECHAKGRGSKLLAEANRLGIKWTICRLWFEGFEKEKQLKRLKNNKRLCPICNNMLNKGADNGKHSDNEN